MQHIVIDAQAARAGARGARAPRGRGRWPGSTLGSPWVACTALLAGIGVLACASAIRPAAQDFWRVETRDFEILSAFGEQETRELARELQLFHAGVLAALGLDRSPDWFPRTRVLAFDDRVPGRPFAVDGQASMYVPGVDQGTIVFRVPGSWDQRASWTLKTDYAREVVRSRSRERLPLWLEEGLAQVAAASKIEKGGIWLGALVDSHYAEIRDWKRGDLSSVLQETDLSGVSDRGREVFRAHAWALVHALMFDATTARGARSFPGAFWRDWDARAGLYPGLVVRDLLDGDGAEWGGRTRRHFDKKDFALRVLREQDWSLEALVLEPVSFAEAATWLGELALALDRPALAVIQFDQALEVDPTTVQARAGLAAALATTEDFAYAEHNAVRAVQASGARDARVLLRAGVGYLDGARQTEDPGESARRLAEADRWLRASLALDPTRARPHLDLARVALERDEPFEEVARQLEAARQLRPHALEIELVAIRLELRQGRQKAVRLRAQDLLSRTTWRPYQAQARALLDAARG
jgi:tetratricopeptide (TPR) repeat protein